MDPTDLSGLGPLLGGIDPTALSMLGPEALKPDYEEQAAETIEKREEWRDARRVHEPEWFICTAMYRGNHDVDWDVRTGRLKTQGVPGHRSKIKVNKFQAKIRARCAKFVKNRPKPLVVPATTEYQDYMNAKASQKVLDYAWRKAHLEEKFKHSMTMKSLQSMALWWFYWDPLKTAKVQQVDPQTGMKSYTDQQVGDVCVELGSPFELLVADPGVSSIGKQPEIMRIRMQKVVDMQTRYPEFAEEITESGEAENFFNYEKQIAGLNQHTFSADLGKKKTGECLVTEHFIRPSAERPEGEYRVLCGNVCVKVEALPYGFHDMENPYPVEIFVDVPIPGQFWGTTVAAQLIDLQKERNMLRRKGQENIKIICHPKILVAKQHQLPKSAWTSEAGEIVEYVAIPSLPPPQPFFPPNIASDVWKSLEINDKEFDDITQVFPAAEGKAGGATSGFQTNLLQEATDSVHAPDIRLDELVIEAVCYKLRRMIKHGYEIPRLISAIGRNYEPDIFEFVGDQVDEAADIVVEVGSGLPTMKAARQDAVVNLYQMGLMGDPADPSVRARALSMLEMGSIDEGIDVAKTDENQARLENKISMDGGTLPIPHFWEHHQIHYTEHTLLMKSPVWGSMDPAVQKQHIGHTVLHARFINPFSALQIAQEEGLIELIPLIQGMLPQGGPLGVPGAAAPGQSVPAPQQPTPPPPNVGM